VRKDVLKGELQRSLPQTEVQTLLSSVPEQVSYDDFVKRITVPDVTSGRILPHTPKETGRVDRIAAVMLIRTMIKLYRQQRHKRCHVATQSLARGLVC
jgi:hypothetical protein